MNALSKLNNLKYSAVRIEAFGCAPGSAPSCAVVLKAAVPKEDSVKRLFNVDIQKRWGTFSIYEKFEHLIITLLTDIIAAIVGAATWQFILPTYDLVRSHLVDPRDSQVFQTVFGMVLRFIYWPHANRWRNLYAVRSHHKIPKDQRKMIWHGNKYSLWVLPDDGPSERGLRSQAFQGAAYIPRRMANATDWVNSVKRLFTSPIEPQSKFLMAASGAGRRSRIAVPPPGTESTTKLP
jgi:hypothetical protein